VLDGLLVDRDCEVYITDVKVQVEANRKYFYPDVMVTCDGRDRDAQMVQYPCLIVEVLSSSTEAVDRGAKFTYYRRFATLREYVLIQQERPIVEVFCRNEVGKWVLTEYGLGDVIDLESLGCQVSVLDLYDRVVFDAIDDGD
jgi:Uma2 family endonuclease